MKSVKEMIEVMQAYERGENIQFYDYKDDKWYCCNCTPDWDWHGYDYRIAPKYVPFNNADEFIKAQSEKKTWYVINNVTYKQYECFVNYLGDIALISLDSKNKITLSDLYSKYHFNDGTPCGIEEK